MKVWYFLPWKIGYFAGSYGEINFQSKVKRKRNEGGATVFTGAKEFEFGKCKEN